MNKKEIAKLIADKYNVNDRRVEQIISQSNSTRIMNELNVYLGMVITPKVQKMVKDLAFNGKHPEALEAMVDTLINDKKVKKCGRCKEIKFLTEYHKGGTYCKPCTTEYNKEMRERLWEKGVEQGYLHCGKCDTDKPIEEFSKGNQNQCKTCRNSKSKPRSRKSTK